MLTVFAAGCAKKGESEFKSNVSDNGSFSNSQNSDIGTPTLPDGENTAPNVSDKADPHTSSQESNTEPATDSTDKIRPQTGSGTTSKEGGNTPNTSTTAPKPNTTTTLKTTAKKPNVTEAPPVQNTAVNVKYVVRERKMGTISGRTEQTIIYGKGSTSSVTVNANLGYKFVGWSDGLKSASRGGDAPSKDTTYEAIFQVDARELPIIMLDTSTGGDVQSKEYYIDGHISVLNTEEKYLLDRLEMQIRGRGNYTWDSTFNGDPMYNKRPYRIKLSEQQKLCGVGKGKSKNWVLLADHCDQSLLRNNIVYTFAKSMPAIYWQPSVQSVEVFLNGEYRGVYLLTEQVDVNSNKVNISEDLTSGEVAFLVMYTGYANIWSEEGFSVGGNSYEIKSDLSFGTLLASQQKSYIINCVQDCWDAVQSSSQSRVEALMDIDTVIDTYIIHELFKNLDTGWDNFYMYKNLGGKLCFGPVWEFDQCAGNADEGVDNPQGIRGGNTQPWYFALLKCGWFRKMLSQRWNNLKESVDGIPSLIVTTANSGYNSYCRNFEKWRIFGYKINRETYVRQLTSYKEHYEYFANFMRERIEWLDGYWNGIEFAFDGKLTLSGSGTMADPYRITSAEDFLNFTLCMLSSQTFKDKFFIQTNNIDLAGVSAYNGAGSSATFAGFYNGNGYTINVNIDGNDNSVFPYVSGTLINVITTGTISNSEMSAGIARSVRSDGAIINCASYVDITSYYGNAGGITASNQAGAVIANCFFGGSLYSYEMTGPINVWYSDRPGDFFGNVYLIPVSNTTEYVDNGQSEFAISEISNETVKMMNEGAKQAASRCQIDISKLCPWRLASGKLLMTSQN